MSEFKPENIREVKVPLAVDQIKEFFVNKELLYFVNYKESDLKGAVFLTYLSNLDLPAEINFEGCSFEEKEEVLKIYANSRNITTSDTLRLNLANILLQSRGLDTSEIFLNLIFTPEEVDQFIEKNKDLIFKWNQFIESTVLYAQCTIEALAKKEEIVNEFGVVEDSNFIGANVVNMFSIPSFMELFLSVGFKTEIKYFKHQFEEYMYRGNNLFSFYMNEHNTPFLVFVAMFETDLDMMTLATLGKESREISKELDG